MAATQRTGPQTKKLSAAVYISPGIATLSRGYKRPYEFYREMRRDPTIKLARLLCIAPVMSADWAYEKRVNAPAGAGDFIAEQIEPHRLEILRSGLLGNIDFGFAPYENVFDFDGSGAASLVKVKRLLQDFTDILVDVRTGDFVGYQQAVGASGGASGGVVAAESVLLFAPHCLHVALDVEGTDWYGQADMEAAVRPYEQWNKVEEAADRYDRKIAGAHWVVYYPLGKSKINDVWTNNFEIAKRLINRLESSGGVAVPTKIAKHVSDLNAQTPNAWKIEIISDTTKAGDSFIQRQKYLDALKVRAFGLPERAILEGQYGTKAEAEAHADFAIMAMQVKHLILAQALNRQLVDALLCMNYGEAAKGTVYIRPAEIVDADRMFLRDIYKALLATPEGFATVADKMDQEALADRLGIPVLPEDDVDAVGAVFKTMPGGEVGGEQDANEPALPVGVVE